MVEGVKRYYTGAKILRTDASWSRETAIVGEESLPLAATYESALLKEVSN